jgi:uncharacterized protein (TIGR00255 family)
MTGFGRATARSGATEATVEVRSVNGRFAEVAIRGPRIVGAFEPAIQAGVKEALVRGSVTVGVTIQRRGEEAGLVVDADAARQVARTPSRRLWKGWMRCACRRVVPSRRISPIG